MAVTLTTLKTETLSDLQESATSANPLYTPADFIAWTNRFYDQYGARMGLQGLVDYTWPADQLSIALATVSATLLQVLNIATLDDDDVITSLLERRQPGDSDGFYIHNNILYLNGTAPTEATDTRWFVNRKPTKATAISDNADIHGDYERSVLIPWFMYCAYKKAKKFVTADGFRKEFLDAFKDMTKDRARQAKLDREVFAASDGYSPLTGV